MKNPVLCIDEEHDDEDYIPAELVSIAGMVNLWREISIPTYQLCTEAGRDYQVIIDMIAELRKLGATELQNIRYNKIGTEVRAKIGDTWYSSLDNFFERIPKRPHYKYHLT